MTEISAWPKAAKIKKPDGSEGAQIDLQTALNKAKPGDVITLQPGTYRDPVVMTNRGKKGAPITVRAADPANTLLDGGRAPEDGLSGGLEPMDGDWAMFKIFRSSHVVIEGLAFKNCWPQSFYLRGAADITIRDLEITGSRYAVFARSAPFRPARRLRLERIRWVQDAQHDMWKGLATWREVKAKDGETDKSWFNGGLFGSFDIQGDVLIRDCDVCHAFNGVRMDIREKGRVSGGAAPRVKRNRNVRIIGCRFGFIRDNAIEPEMGAEGWLVADNLFAHVHATLSLDGVTLRDFAFVGNRILNLKRPGGEPKQSNSGGKIIKFLGDKDFEEEGVEPKHAKNFVTAFNSVRTRTRYLQDAALKPWSDRNNAVERVLALNGEGDFNLFSKVIWRKGATMDGLASNAPDYPSETAHGSHPKQGAVFEAASPPPDPDDFPLGGWTGDLPPTDEVNALATVKVSLFGPDGLKAEVPAGMGSGWKSLATLGLSKWATPDWLTDTPVA